VGKAGAFGVGRIGGGLGTGMLGISGGSAVSPAQSTVLAVG
jgi:hypothetical protein